MAFKFNFDSNDDINIATEKNNAVKVEWLPCKEITPQAQIKNLDTIAKRASMFTCGELEIGHVIASDVLSQMCNSSDPVDTVVLAEGQHSDLIPGKYEGGLKIWECTYDLIQYLIKNEDVINWEKAKVLDLGCGAGLLGIYAFLNGADVTYQDYNQEVLESVTIPNVILNMEEEDRESGLNRLKFYSGDWESFDDVLQKSEHLFDYILTSETIYNSENHNKLIQLFRRRLRKGGSIYVAAKTYYFGVGGGTREFEILLAKSGGLKSEVCWKSSGGIQREILKVTHQSLD